jgi:alpha-ketoglutarate-dependent taurine dioxygenase
LKKNKQHLNLINDLKLLTEKECFKIYKDITKEDFSKICDYIISDHKIKYCQHGYLGRVNIDFSNSINDELKDFKYELAYHTDGFYHETIPELACMYCEAPGPYQIPTEFINTNKLLSTLDKSDIEILKTLNIVFIANDRRKYIKPLIENYNGHDILNWIKIGYFSIDETKCIKGLPSLKSIINSTNSLQKAIEHSEVLSHNWEKGDVILWNNRYYIHGRGFINKSLQDNNTKIRRLKRIYFDHSS